MKDTKATGIMMINCILPYSGIGEGIGSNLKDDDKLSEQEMLSS